MAAISFVIACKELKIAQIAQINQFFPLLNLICAYDDAFNGLTRVLISKNANNAVSKDSPIQPLENGGV